MNTTYIRNVYERPLIFTDFESEMWTILIMCILILTRGVVSSIMKLLKSDDIHHHVHYSNEYSTADLNLDVKPKPQPKPKTPTAPPNSPAGEKKNEFDNYESFRIPRPPPRDELV